MPRHIAVDLETLSLRPDALIVSIGAAVFSEKGIESEHYWVLNLDQPNRHLDAETLAWWLQQDTASRAVFDKDNARVSITQALTELATLFDPDTRFWSNGANFDEVILADAYRRLGSKTPWSYKNVRCFRTMRAQHPEVKYDRSQGVKHNALDDALWEALTLLEIMKVQGLELL